MSVAFPDVVVFDGFILLWSSLFTRKQNAREGKKAHVVISDHTEPVRTGIGAVCVEYGRPRWPITMLNNTHLVQNSVLIFFWHPMIVRPVMKRLFFPWKTMEKKARFARAPHY